MRCAAPLWAGWSPRPGISSSTHRMQPTWCWPIATALLAKPARSSPSEAPTKTCPACCPVMRETDGHALLTPRELEVLAALAEGMTNKAIARRLNISLHTVKFHVESVFRKLGARTRTEAVAKASERRRFETITL